MRSGRLCGSRKCASLAQLTSSYSSLTIAAQALTVENIELQQRAKRAEEQQAAMAEVRGRQR